jgi:hypothetical protein
MYGTNVNYSRHGRCLADAWLCLHPIWHAHLSIVIDTQYASVANAVSHTVLFVCCLQP